MIRVIIADDHHLVRQGIRALLEKAGDMQVIGEAADGQEAVEMAERLQPDVLLLDIAMPRLNGVEAAGRVRSLDLPVQVVILSMYSDETLVRQALRSGARGYLLKSSVTEELLLAVRAAVHGETYLSPAISASLVAELLAQPAGQDDVAAFGRLSPREREVLQLVTEGHTNAEIAALMHISAKTVEKHRASVMEKLGVHDLAGLIRAAIKYGVVFVER
ncbi:MAG: response regulator transcription factor [Chloroflexi bacterium]|nr:response regulator transcription factor [Chloroflexota bacterium]